MDSLCRASPSHKHCELGLFHDSDPLHTHAHCKQCFRMPRCEGSGAAIKLFRCSACSEQTYCSKKCQKEHWRSGHKLLCNAQKVFRDRSVQQSGNPSAWSDLMQWAVFHHSTLINAALACYIRPKHTVPNITSQYLLQLSLNYRNDPSLPVERKFELAGTHFTPRDGPFASSLYEHIFEERLVAVELGKIEMGDDLYWGTGAYLLIVRFRPSTVNVCFDGVPFWKHFGIDKIHANTRPACRNPIEQLQENLMQGRKMKFCCGRLEGLPTCCCGGWTHQVSGHGPKVGW